MVWVRFPSRLGSSATPALHRKTLPEWSGLITASPGLCPPAARFPTLYSVSRVSKGDAAPRTGVGKRQENQQECKKNEARGKENQWVTARQTYRGASEAGTRGERGASVTSCARRLLSFCARGRTVCGHAVAWRYCSSVRPVLPPFRGNNYNNLPRRS